MASIGAPGRGPRVASSSVTSFTRAANRAALSSSRWPYSLSIAPHPALLTTIGSSPAPKAATFSRARRRASCSSPACSCSAPQHTCSGTSRTAYPFTSSVRMVASWTWEKRPSITHPRNKLTGVNAECGVRNAELTGELRFRIPNSTFRTGFVAPSIPIANRTRPQPASQRGIPVARSARARAYTTRDTPPSVMAARARRASAGTPRRSAISARAAASPRPYPTPEGHTGSHPRQPRQRSRCSARAGSSGASSPASSARISSMRPRGLSASSPVARKVGHAWRQKPQCTQGSSAANPPRSVIQLLRPPRRTLRRDRTCAAARLRAGPLPRGTRRNGRRPSARARGRAPA